MSFYFSDGSPAVIIMATTTRRRLAKTCFRGSDLKFAGNFRFWSSFEQLLKSRNFVQRLLDHAQSVVEEANDLPTTTERRIEIAFSEAIGWSSTAPRAELPAGVALETFALNAHCVGQKVVGEWKAPLTKKLTVVYTLQFEEVRGWVILVHTLYPGPDIGRLDGDVSAENQVVFFEWTHLGE